MVFMFLLMLRLDAQADVQAAGPGAVLTWELHAAPVAPAAVAAAQSAVVPDVPAEFAPADVSAQLFRGVASASDAVAASHVAGGSHVVVGFHVVVDFHAAVD
jgi:hypothetical protein